MTSQVRGVLGALLLVALVVAGLVSGFASSSPDGLTAVSESKGFAALETDHAAADSPLAGYATRGVTDDRLSGGIAGVAGVLMTFGVGAALFLAVRRRGAAGSVPEPGAGAADARPQNGGAQNGAPAAGG